MRFEKHGAYDTEAVPPQHKAMLCILVVIVGIDPTSSPYEGGAHPSTPYHRKWLRGKDSNLLIRLMRPSSTLTPRDKTGLRCKNRTCASWSQTTGDAISLIGEKLGALIQNRTVFSGLQDPCIASNALRAKFGITLGLVPLPLSKPPGNAGELTVFFLQETCLFGGI